MRVYIYVNNNVQNEQNVKNGATTTATATETAIASSNGRTPEAAADRRKFESHSVDRRLFCKKWMWKTQKMVIFTSAKRGHPATLVRMSSDVGSDQQRRNQRSKLSSRE